MRRLKAVVCLCSLLSVAPAAGPGCPSDMVVARSGVCIDRYEWPNKEGARPLVGASGVIEEDGPLYDAELLCQMAGKRVCTRSEWVGACSGPGGAKYPYGTKYDPAACNTERLWRKPDMVKVARRNEREMNRLDQSAPAGSFSKCVSPSGAYDMVGNAEEWVRCDNGEFGWCLVGGYWASAQSSCSYHIVKHAPNWHYFETSFRCCKDMEN